MTCDPHFRPSQNHSPSASRHAKHSAGQPARLHVPWAESAPGRHQKYNGRHRQAKLIRQNGKQNSAIRQFRRKRHVCITLSVNIRASLPTSQDPPPRRYGPYSARSTSARAPEIAASASSSATDSPCPLPRDPR